MTDLGSPRVLMSAIESLYLYSHAPIRDETAAELLSAKEAAQRASKARAPLPTAELGGHVFDVQPTGARKAPLRLESEHLTLLVTPRPARGLPSLGVELSALFLWQRGVREAMAVVRAVAEAVAVPFPESSIAPRRNGPPCVEFQISRADLTTDFQGWAPPRDPEHFTTCGTKVTAFYDNRRFTGITFGKGAVVARIYDKTQEIRTESPDKRWFYDLWSKCPGFDPGAPVWRLEYQLRRAGLRAYAIGPQRRPLTTPEEVEASAGPLWRVLMSDWLSMRRRTATSRKALAPEWAVLQRHGFERGPWNGCPENLYRLKRTETAARSAAQFRGYLKREVAALAYETGAPVDVASAGPELLKRAASHVAPDGTTLEEGARDLVEAWRGAERAAIAPPAAFAPPRVRRYRMHGSGEGGSGA